MNPSADLADDDIGPAPPVESVLCIAWQRGMMGDGGEVYLCIRSYRYDRGLVDPGKVGDRE